MGIKVHLRIKRGHEKFFTEYVSITINYFSTDSCSENFGYFD